ncbi:MAG: hypothetical protein A2751_02465 [Candidatus Doudnabacteria bacterium RIFCSPHIGHO2_01_FULL_46_14]|uniref:Cytidyltransferase-like domain-containing protein n=1 Tax=Candidatus Doudnabacteria bacterium RIFCSPHIGHO2_01_FULL_46_14 TaxID=1817824 RepID=A0A1F5NJR0_9BACT|nr:MAG: hypothetical protein A2751_02465 [Candidatus Doudnabacteria bacterium RIFCSPHIGHO2_01_FULL_46_14]
MTIVAVSGGFDPLHVGHINLLREAKHFANAHNGKLLVILNNDNWLRAKKGFTFMPEKEREAVLRATKYVDDVVITSHQAKPSDMSVCKELERLKPTHFFNGGDRRPDLDPVPEVELCRKLGIEMIYNVGGQKVQSSSVLTKKASDAQKQ